jgi:hypothetical protein
MKDGPRAPFFTHDLHRRNVDLTAIVCAGPAARPAALRKGLDRVH